MRAVSWTIALLLILLSAGAVAFACGGGGGNGEVNLNNVPTATLPSTLPAPVIVSGTSQPAPGGTYVVKSGETPSSIAAQLGVSVDALMAANGITDPTALHAGQVLVIPGGSNVLGNQATPQPTARATATARPAQTPSTGQQTYTVRAGDIPETIAAQFGITADALMAANSITDPTSLQIGQVLIIPAPHPTATPAQ